MQLYLIPFKHNHFAMRTLIDLCRTLRDEQLHRSFPIGVGNVHDSLLHVIGAMARWTDRIGDRPLRPRIEGTKLSMDEMAALLDRTAAELEAVVVEIVQANRQDEMMEFPAGEGQPPYRFHRASAMVHVTTHGVHHRAQVLNMLRHIGLTDLPDLDPIDWELAHPESW